jgi:hypothetical protein
MSWVSLNSAENPQKSDRRIQTILFIVFLVCVCGLIASLVWSIGVYAKDSRWMPFSLHSILQSDYSIDPRTQLLPPVRFELIKNYINEVSETDSPERYATLQGLMNTPVATVTPVYNGALLTPTIPSPTASSPALSTPTQTPSPTKSILPTQTALPTFTLTPTPTSFPSPTPWNPPIPSPTPVPTATPNRQDSHKPTKPAPTLLPPTNTPTTQPTQPAPPPSPTLPKPTNPYPPPPYP